MFLRRGEVTLLALSCWKRYSVRVAPEGDEGPGPEQGNAAPPGATWNIRRRAPSIGVVMRFVDEAVITVKAGKGGSIINVGSIYGMVSPVQDIYAYKEEMTGIPFVKPVAYSAAKSGIYNLTRYLATYWGKKNIRVNTFTPSGVWRDTQDEYFQANYCNRIPIGRMAKEDEYNGAIIFLASDASRYMTGSNLIMDGGWTAW